MAVSENDRGAERKQVLTLKNRENLSLDGVLEVVSFDEGAVVLKTALGRLTVEGEGLHVTKLLLDCGEVSLEGKIRGMYYDDTREGGRTSFFRRFG